MTDPDPIFHDSSTRLPTELPHQLTLVHTAPSHQGMAILSWPGDASQRCPIPVLTVLDVEQLRWSRPACYCCAKPTATCILWFWLSSDVRLSVRLSRRCIVSTRLKISPNFFLGPVTPSF